MNDHAKTPTGPERRAVEANVELRAAKEGSKSPGTLVGYAARFGTMSVPLPMPHGGTFREVIRPGAFRSCMGDDVRCLRNHLDDVLLGRSRSGTLRFEEDAQGLRYECDLPDTTHGRDTAEMVRSGNMNGCSFQFQVDDNGDEWTWSDSEPIRTVTRYKKLFDVGPVTFPAYEDSRVDCRSYNAAKAAKDAAEAEEVRKAQEHVNARLRVAKALS